MQQLILQNATVGLACSQVAGEDLFGPAWGEDHRFRLHFCGIDLTPFTESPDPATVRASLGLSSDSFVVGHVGRFADQKNQEFLIPVAQALLARVPSLKCVLIGDGPNLERTRALVRERGLDEVFIFTGTRQDIPAVMKAAFDVFVFPSRFEGLGLVGVEAQAAGLPCIVSDRVPPEVGVIPEFVRHLSLDAPPEAWADAILSMANRRSSLSPSEAWSAVAGSTFNIKRQVGELTEIYRSAHDRHRRAGT
jgi:glycosyltransferase involved in cell wall biosynthesis